MAKKLKKLFKYLKLCWRIFNYDTSTPARYDRIRTREAWKAWLDRYERLEYIRRMSGGYPTGERP